MCIYYSTLFYMVIGFKCFNHHMASSQDLFSSFEAPPTSHILMGNNIVKTVCRKGSIDIDDGTFHNVLCVPPLSSNLLSIY